MTNPPAIVVDVNSENGLASARSLGRAGVATIGLSTHPRALGLSSRWCKGKVCPDAATDPDGFVDFLVELGRDEREKAVLIVSGDAHLEAVGPRWDRLDDLFFAPFPSWDRLQNILDKEVQLMAARAAGVGTPRSIAIDDTSINQIDQADIEWPAIVKGRVGKGFARQARRQVLVAEGPDQAREIAHTHAAHKLVLQEIIPGDDSQLYTYGSCRLRNGGFAAEFGGRKLRQHPVNFGGAICAESLDNPALEEDGRRLLDELELIGPSQVEFKLDHRDGKFKLMEVNARLWRWHGLAAYCGVNLAHAAYLDALGKAGSITQRPTRSGRWVYSYYDVPLTARRVARRSYPLGTWLRTARPPACDAIFAFDDPKPYLAGLRNLAATGLERPKPDVGNT